MNNETKWLVRALVALAKRNLAEANATPECQAGEWPARQQWHELSHTSQHVFMRRATAEAGIPHEEYHKLIEGTILEDSKDALDAIWQEMEKPSTFLEVRSNVKPEYGTELSKRPSRGESK